MTSKKIDELTRRYQGLGDQLHDIGFIASGSLIERYTACGTAGCRCGADPPQLHGPYFQYSRKVAGKTVTARLTFEHAQRYREWIANRRKLDALIAEMEEISGQARQLLLPKPPEKRHSATPN